MSTSTTKSDFMKKYEQECKREFDALKCLKAEDSKAYEDIDIDDEMWEEKIKTRFELLDIERKEIREKISIKIAIKRAEKKAYRGREKSKVAYNPPAYPPAQKPKCKGSATMISNAPAQREWLNKWAKGCWDGSNLWSSKTAKKFVDEVKKIIAQIRKEIRERHTNKEI